MSNSPQKPSLKLAGRIFVTIVICAVIGARIWWVNDTAISFPVKKTEMNEQVALDGSYIDTEAENTRGYSLTVKNAWAMTAAEYLDAYVENSNRANIKNETAIIAVLEIEIENKNNNNGYMGALSWRLMTADKTDALYIDWDLWEQAVPAMQGAMGIFAIKPNTTRTLYIPFCRQDVNASELSRATSGTDRADIEGDSFTLVVSSQPVRNEINIELSSEA